MSVESTRAVMDRYFNSQHADTSVMADDVVFTIMGTGQEYSTPQGIAQMLNYFYHVAFDATAEGGSLIVGDGKAALEATFVGKHTGEFAGIPATGKAVRLPLLVFYDIEKDQIKRARVYMEMTSLIAQLGVGAPSTAQA